MINADTQLVFLDEWSPDHLQSDTAKLLLQGGLMISAAKYEKARMFINNSAFHITTNNVPNFGEDEDANVKRRLKIFETQSMPNPNSKIEPWYMHCVAWAAKEITKHRALVEKEELWYEDASNERGEAEKSPDHLQSDTAKLGSTTITPRTITPRTITPGQLPPGQLPPRTNTPGQLPPPDNRISKT